MHATVSLFVSDDFHTMQIQLLDMLGYRRKSGIKNRPVEKVVCHDPDVPCKHPAVSVCGVANNLIPLIYNHPILTTLLSHVQGFIGSIDHHCGRMIFIFVGRNTGTEGDLMLLYFLDSQILKTLA